MTMVKIIRLGLSCLIVLSISVVSYADDNTEIRERLSKHYCLEKPEGKGPFSAVIMVPGCSGFNAELGKAKYDRVQRRLVEMGFVTLRVDYQAARNIANCTEVTPQAVAGDICVACKYLRSQPFVRKEAINLLGWSYGGAGSLWALRRTRDRQPAQVAAVIVYYPYCMGVEEWDSEVPVLALFGTIDNVVRFPMCNHIFTHVPKPDKITVRVYEDAHHSFDNSDIPEPIQYQFGTLGYNEAAAKAAWEEVTNFLRK
jgi:dienelactone hydrolase